MPNDSKTPATRRIDLSDCKLLSTYGRSLVGPTYQDVKVGILTKAGLLTKLGLSVKIGLIGRPR
jgi:hypothetical protein